MKTEEDLSDEETLQKEFKVTLINKMHVSIPQAVKWFFLLDLQTFYSEHLRDKKHDLTKDGAKGSFHGICLFEDIVQRVRLNLVQNNSTSHSREREGREIIAGEI
ncbi:unnamed protein product [Leuciscus chuanchicus]